MVPGLVQAFREQDLARPVVVLMPLYLIVVIPLTGVAMRAAARGNVSRALMLASLLLWGPALAIAILVPPLAVVALLAALVPAVFAIPYASRRTHLQIILISAVVATISATIGAVGFEVIPSRIGAVYNSFGFFVPVGIVAAFKNAPVSSRRIEPRSERARSDSGLCWRPRRTPSWSWTKRASFDSSTRAPKRCSGTAGRR
jgi:hypothetical protein